MSSSAVAESVLPTSNEPLADGTASAVRSFPTHSDQTESSSSVERARWNRRVVTCLLVLGLFRLLYLRVLPLELSVDEAYYWDWSRQLDWGYYSKPPLVAWIIRLGTSIAGETEFGVRWPAAVLGTLGLWAVYALGRDLYSPRVGWWSLWLTCATPGLTAAACLMTIDAPLLCAWAWSVWSVWRLFNRPQLTWRDWGLAWLSTGCGLLAKQTMLALFPLVALGLCWRGGPEGIPRLTAFSRFARWCGGSLLALLPVLWWNAQHHWVTIQHTRDHFRAASVAWWQHAVWCAEFLGSQAGVLSPLTACWCVVAATTAVLHVKRLDSRARFLCVLSVWPLIPVLGLSLMQRVQPNWPAPFYLTAVVWLSALATGEVQGGVPSWRLCGLPRLRAAFAMGAVCVGCVLLLPFVLPATAYSQSRYDPLARLQGWKAWARAVWQHAQTLPEARDARWICVSGRGPISLLAFYLPHQPRVARWNPLPLIESQHDVWGCPPLADPQAVFVLLENQHDLPVGLREQLPHARLLGTVTQIRSGRNVSWQVWYAAPRASVLMTHTSAPYQLAPPLEAPVW
ncbi:MAG: dolichyl-phosphate-mannose--protein mannosyltransferase [Planctomycetaceae bacterium]|nr:MAG: dolichyl-phosphate-mannose--protein mannosyltransferase [Planctomycetaceae bacterium]